jgi:prepilin signal peptidase PulO-like enzyme (type II secretory pathway)
MSAYGGNVLVLDALTRERDQISDLTPRSLCPDCGDALQPGRVICLRSWLRLSGQERRKFGRPIRAPKRASKRRRSR